MNFPPYNEGPLLKLAGELMRLTEEWEKLGIDPDDFLRCGKCHKFIYDLVKDTDPPVARGECCECGA